MMKTIPSILLILLLAGFSLALRTNKTAYTDPDPNILTLQKNEVTFTSEADLETITAYSNKLKGKINKAQKKFEFVISIESFLGFNSPLQREHFLENYMESDIYPKASFSGSIIDPVEWDQKGNATFRTKGKMTIRGISKESIIKVNYVNKDGKLSFSSDFSVLLKDYNIAIPRLVKQKISEEIKVSVSGALQ